MRIRKNVWVFPLLAVAGILVAMFLSWRATSQPVAPPGLVVPQGAPAEKEPENPLKSD